MCFTPPFEKEVGVLDAAKEHLHVFDNTVQPPQSIKVCEQPGRNTFRVDGKLVYLSFAFHPEEIKACSRWLSKARTTPQVH